MEIRGFYIQKDWQVLEVAGKDRVKFLHNLLSNDIQNLAENGRQWSTLLNNKGRLIGFFQVWKKPEKILLFVHRAHKEAVFQTLDKYLITEDVTFSWSNDQVVSLLDSSKTEIAFSTQVPENSKIISNEQYESIRIQMGFPLPLKDYEDPIPLEVPFMVKAISFTKGCYVGQETIARLYSRGMNIANKLLPFECAVDADVSEQNTVMMRQEEVGKVTSIAKSMSGDQKIGLAWIHRKAFGQEVTVNGQKIEIKYG